MKKVFAVFILLTAALGVAAQNEQAPIVEKDIAYKNWTLKGVRDGQNVELRSLMAGKKLVIVAYYAPWCPNWRNDLNFLPRIYDKYKNAGLEIVGVGEYGTIDELKANADTYKIAFPLVYESDSRAQRQYTDHFKYRDATGDKRKWGSPYYVLLETAKVAKKGDALIERTNVINGEMIEAEGEKFIREKLGLPPEGSKAGTAKAGSVEVCDPAKPADLKKIVAAKPQ